MKEKLKRLEIDAFCLIFISAITNFVWPIPDLSFMMSWLEIWVGANLLDVIWIFAIIPAYQAIKKHLTKTP